MKKVKTILVGGAGVDKSNITKYLDENQYATVGAANLRYTCSSSRGDITFTIWDTAGQERYKTLAPMYFAGSYCALLVFDIASKESFERLDEFYDLLQSRAPVECIFVLVGNKIDEEKERQISQEEAEDYSQKIGAIKYVEISTLTGEGIKELFTLIANCPDLHYEDDIKNSYISDLHPPEQNKKQCF